MHFDQHNYPAIKYSCENKKQVEFVAPKAITGFANSDVEVPNEWQAFPPALLPPSGYAEVFIHSGNDARGALDRLELIVHLDGGTILYKKAGDDLVGIKVTWPDSA